MQKVTRDHIFPTSWYPENTPLNLERWTVPSCSSCNAKLGTIEEDLKIRMGLCIDPSALPAMGIADDALRAINPRFARDERDRKSREKKREKIIQELMPIARNAQGILPNFGPHPGQEGRSTLVGIPIPASHIEVVGNKILRGLYYKFERRFVELPLKIDILVVHPEAASPFDNLLHKFGQFHHRGPGIELWRAKASDSETTFVAKIIIWGRFEVRGSIVAPVEIGAL